jgi:hypothetical protein
MISDASLQDEAPNQLFTVEGVIAGWMSAGASVPGQRCGNAAGGPILCHRS